EAVSPDAGTPASKLRRSRAREQSSGPASALPRSRAVSTLPRTRRGVKQSFNQNHSATDTHGSTRKINQNRIETSKTRIDQRLVILLSMRSRAVVRVVPWPMFFHGVKSGTERSISGEGSCSISG